jgi:TonB family protein
MSAAVMQLENAEYQRRTRWTLSVSAVLHVLLLLCLVLAPRAIYHAPELTEVTLLEPGDLGGAPAPSGTPAQAASEHPGLAARHLVDQSFLRSTTHDEMSPEPQSADAFADRLTSRLASTHENDPAPVQGVSSTALARVWSTPSPVAGGVGGGNGPLKLSRGDGGSGSAPLMLTRGGTGSAPAPALAATGLPKETAAEKPAGGGENTVRKVAAGAMLSGPIADRAVIAYTRPVYPEWAKRDAVEGSVTLYFIVRPDGGVRENILVQKTAGFEDFDENARAALKQWRFAPLKDGRTGEQWGTITFHYRLQEAG